MSPFPLHRKRDGGCSLLARLHRYEGAALARPAEDDLALGGGEDGVVLADAYVSARVKLGAALAQDNIAGEHILAAVALDAEAPTGAVAPVARTAACFLVGHGFCSLVLAFGLGLAGALRGRFARLALAGFPGARGLGLRRAPGGFLRLPGCLLRLVVIVALGRPRLGGLGRL